jgi:hypothetical protein
VGGSGASKRFFFSSFCLEFRPVQAVERNRWALTPDMPHSSPPPFSAASRLQPWGPGPRPFPEHSQSHGNLGWLWTLSLVTRLTRHALGLRLAPSSCAGSYFLQQARASMRRQCNDVALALSPYKRLVQRHQHLATRPSCHHRFRVCRAAETCARSYRRSYGDSAVRQRRTRLC